MLSILSVKTRELKRLGPCKQVGQKEIRPNRNSTEKKFKIDLKLGLVLVRLVKADLRELKGFLVQSSPLNIYFLVGYSHICLN